MSTHHIRSFRNKVIQNIDFIDSLLEPARVFARSYGLEPFRIIRIDSKALKEALLQKRDNPSESLAKAALIILAISSSIANEHITGCIAEVLASKKATYQSLDNYRQCVESCIWKSDDINWCSRQARPSLDILSSSAKDSGAALRLVDKFDAELYDESLDLKKEGFTAHIVVVLKEPEHTEPWPIVPELNN